MSQKIALITGGSRGLGRNAALKLAEKGIDVILTYRSQKREAESVVARIQALGARAVALPLDAGDSQGFSAFVSEVTHQLKKIWQRETFDYLFNNAGAALYAPFMDTTEAQFDQLVNLSLIHI